MAIDIINHELSRLVPVSRVVTRTYDITDTILRKRHGPQFVSGSAYGKRRRRGILTSDFIHEERGRQ
jgi:hypothetical protein